jgi:hypothetical protein
VSKEQNNIVEGMTGGRESRVVHTQLGGNRRFKRSDGERENQIFLFICNKGQRVRPTYTLQDQVTLPPTHKQNL